MFELDEDLSKAIEHANTVLRKCCIDNSRKIEDMQLDGVREITKTILESYGIGKIDELDFCDFCDAIELVIHRKFGHLFPKTLYPDFDKHDCRSLAFDAIHYIQIIGANFKKKSIPVFLDFLDATDSSAAHEQLISYVHNQYDYTKDLIT